MAWKARVCFVKRLVAEPATDWMQSAISARFVIDFQAMPPWVSTSTVDGTILSVNIACYAVMLMLTDDSERISIDVVEIVESTPASIDEVIEDLPSESFADLALHFGE